MSKSRLSGLYKLNVSERITALEKQGWLAPAAAHDLRLGREVLAVHAADKMIENVIGVFGLPLAVAPNFIVNERECLVPLVVEEPSIVAALSSAAALARRSGGFSATITESLLAGQIHIVGVTDPDATLLSLRAAAGDLLSVADEVHPRLQARGGGVRDIEFRVLQLADAKPLIVVHVLVDTCDAMGANLVNTICEALAPRVAEISGGDIALSILSNLTDRSLCSATVRYAATDLASVSLEGERVRDQIVLASDIACADTHRAVTHNKGVMNGIDALALATGNDWRAIEAGAHAFAARDGHYSALTQWSVATNGDLVGGIVVPLKPATVGGTLSSNPAAALGLAISGVESASQLAELMAAVGLAQNFAALRALVSDGIQEGHMRLHARSVAAAAGTPDDRFDEVVAKLVASSDIKDWKAAQILGEVDETATQEHAAVATAAGKIILFGEHAVVYGRHALAIPIVDAVSAAVTRSDESTILTVQAWGLHKVVDRKAASGADAAVNLILDELGVGEEKFRIDVSSGLPRGMGLGSSAALAVAITRAVAQCAGADIDDARVNTIAFACEKLAHGTPSGIDNTLSCYGESMLFRNSGSFETRSLQLAEYPPLVIALAHTAGATHAQVAGVRSRFEQDKKHYECLFDQIDEISRAGAELLLARRYDELGRLMNICHGLLNAIEVSTPDLEHMVAIARQHGASGAKLTGAGGGGAIVALCPGAEGEVRAALQQSGYKTLPHHAAAGVSCD